MLSRSILKTLVIVLLSVFASAQVVAGGKSIAGGKSVAGGGVQGGAAPTLTVLNRVVDRAAYNNKVTCNAANPTVCVLTIPSTTAGSYGIIHLHGEEGSAFTIASISGACTWSRPTGANVFLSGSGISDAMVCTDGMTAAATSVTITFTGPTALSNPDYVNPQYLEVSCSGSCTPTVVASSTSNGSTGTTFTSSTLALGGSQSIVSQLSGCDNIATAAASPYDTNFTNNSIPGAAILTETAVSYVANVTSTGAAVWTVTAASSCVGSAVAIKAN